MARLVIKERVRRLRRALAWLQLRGACELWSSMWFLANVGFLYTLGRLEADDIPTRAARRDIDNFLSPQDCINFLRFSQAQVRAQDRGANSRCNFAKMLLEKEIVPRTVFLL